MSKSTMTHHSEPSEQQSTLAHSRNISTVSSVTLHTSNTHHSQPYEPLLRPISPGSGEYHDLVSHTSRPSERILSLPRWSQSNVQGRSMSSLDEQKSYSDHRPRKRQVVLRWSKNILQVVMAAWAIYSTARYFIAFTVYQSITGQAFSLALGTATGLSFAFACCASILWTGQTFLLVHGFSVHALVTLRHTLHFLASCCLFGPSLVNLVLIFLWKRSPDLELQTRHRCKLDIDLVWSARDTLCNYKKRTWGFWLTLSIVRLVVTLLIIIAFHLITSSTQFTPARSLAKSHYLKAKKSRHRVDPSQSPLMSENPFTGHRNSILQHQSSESTLSGKSSPRNRLHPSRSQSSTFSEQGQSPSYHKSEFTPKNNEHSDSNQEITGFSDRFRTLISQITRETEAALAFARSDNALSSNYLSDSTPSPPSKEIEEEDNGYSPHLHPNDDDEDDFYASSPAYNVSHSDYLQAYPADEHIRMLNGYVRRMPTIESMGSREWRSSVGASSQNTNRDRTGTSRPPTRGGRLSWADTEYSEPRSQSNSLSAQAEVLAGMSSRGNATEIGELFRRQETIRIVDTHFSSGEGSEALSEVNDREPSVVTRGAGNDSDSYRTASTVSSVSSALADALHSPLPTQALHVPGEQ